MNTSDFAIVVGINYYPGIGDLAGAEFDADQFADWLQDPGGGGLPPQNVMRVRTADFHPPKPARPFAARPDENDFNARLLEIVLDSVTNLPRQPAGRRLYLYFSGHGFSGTDPDDAAVFSANAIHPSLRHIAANQYARWLHAGALFEEIVLIMDCCRDMSLVTHILSPSLSPLANSARAGAVRRLTWYAAPFGAKARECRMEAAGPVRGVFTYVLLEALRRTPGDATGDVWADKVADYVHTRWPVLAPNQQPPVLPVDAARNIVLTRRTAAPKTAVSVHVLPPAAPDAAVVVSNYMAGAPREIARQPLADLRASIALAPGLYKFSVSGSERSVVAEIIGRDAYVEF